MYTLERLRKWDVSTSIGDRWVPGRPLINVFSRRLRDAWAVLIGKADAFTWPEGQ